MKAFLTSHSRDRLKERVGIPKRAQRRMARLAFERGISPDHASGSFKHWLLSKAMKSAALDGGDLGEVILRIHGYKVYLFRKHKYFKSDNVYALLVTVLNIPQKLFKMADLARECSAAEDGGGT